jgi:hypothetical protein
MQHNVVIFNRKENKLGFIRNDKAIIYYVKNLRIVDILMGI